MERRTKSRMDVRLTCYVSAGKIEAAPMRSFTENVSRHGILMHWGKGVPLPKIEGKLGLDLMLPENSEFGARVMRCRAEVIRVTSAAEGHEVALRIRSVRFMKGRSAQVR